MRSIVYNQFRKELHIITATLWISSLRQLFDAHLRCDDIQSFGLMRYNDSFAIVDDMPLLSQWIKK